MKKNLKKKLKKVKKIRNTGFDLSMELAHQNIKTDYVLGAASQKCIAEIPSESRMAYLPLGELQFGREDFMDCATRSWLNIKETKLNYLVKNKLLPAETIQWLRDKGYYSDDRGAELSDRFIAIKSGTSRSGNSLIAPLQAGHKYGVIPKKMLPARSDMTWDDYHNQADITSEMENLGLEFLKRIAINYEKVYKEQFSEFRKRDMLNTAGYAWPQPVNGIYPRVEYQYNHAFMDANLPEVTAFDNYLDEGKQGDFLKQLAPDYELMNPSYRIILSIPKKGLSFLDLIRRFFGKKV